MALARDPRTPLSQSLDQIRAAAVARRAAQGIPEAPTGMEAARQTPGTEAYAANQRNAARDNADYNSMGSLHRYAVDKGLTQLPSADDIKDEIGHTVTAPINPEAGVTMAALEGLPLLRNVGRSAAGTLNRSLVSSFQSMPSAANVVRAASAASAAPTWMPGINDTVAVARGEHPIDQGAYDPAVEAAAGAHNGNVNVTDSKTMQQQAEAVIAKTRQDALLRDHPSIETSDLNASGSGLSRIVRTAPGVYTDAAGAKGDVRYYDQLGNRADRAQPTGITANTSVADYNKAVDAAPSLLDTRVGRRAMSRQGTGSLARVADMKGEATKAAQAAFLAGLSPSDRAALLSDQAKNAHDDLRSNAEIASREKIAGAEAQDRALARGDARDASHQEIQDKRYADNPAAAVNLSLSKIAGKTTAEQDKFFKTDEGRQVFSYLQDTLAKDQSPLLNFTNGLSRAFGGKETGAPTLDNMEPGVFSDYRRRDASIIGPGSSGAELGINSDLFGTAVRAYNRQKGNGLTKTKGK